MIVTCDDVVMNVWLFTCSELAFVKSFITYNLLVYNEHAKKKKPQKLRT
jgi:hypothetical protein